jgi:hypothetical protein
MMNSKCIEQYNMASKLDGIEELHKVLAKWRKSNPDTFRLDGHDTIGPANPSQWIFFELQDFKESDFDGEEYGKKVTGQEWNGIYYLTASVRGEAIDSFLKLYKIYKNSSDIFKLTYTAKKEGIPSKRKLLIKDTPEEINLGWFCKQYYRGY